MIRKFLPEYLVLLACLVAGLLLLAFFPRSADAQSNAKLCPMTMPSETTELECSCPQTGGGANVWGTDFYTDDSSLCHAAVHTGAIPAEGGVIHVRTMPGRDYYTGSQRNGVTSRDYGSWSRTVVFVGARTAGDATPGVPLCPGAYHDIGTNWSGTCRCPDAGDGVVWGSGPYTSDSNVCRAARHAGVIGARGGLVQLTPAPGQDSYAGSTRNGVTSSNWASYGSSFRVSAPTD